MKAPSELERCRQSTSFEVSRLAAMLDTEGRDGVKAEILKVMMKEPAFDKSKRPFLSRSEALAAGISATRRLLQLKRQHEWNPQQLSIAMELLGDTYSLTLHELAFRPVIASQGSDEQQAHWLPLASNYAIFGCYAQTELGHGSNVQNLETTATYDIESETFEIHSPTLTSTKWWMGGLGVMATHCIVQAQLLIPAGGKLQSHGPHLFIMRIRDEKSHQPLGGIRIGDIGPKAHGAMSGLDNGYIRFSHVRIPRTAMLSRFAQVSRDGVYTKPPHAKLSYGGMIYIRAQMISSLARALASSVTIATRYLHVRRQFSDNPKNVETQVIRYASVYMRIVPALLNAYVFIMLGKQMVEEYHAMASKLKDGDTSLLADVHAMSSGLKVYVSTAVVEDCETCRRACGGHGFMASSGLAAIYAHQLPSTTYEGDNYILNQQVCRAAVKAYSKTGSHPGLGSDLPSTGMLKPETAIGLLQLRAQAMVKQLAEEKSGKRSWTDLSWSCAAVAQAITEANIAKHIERAINDLRGRHRDDSTEVKVLTSIYEAWLFCTTERARADLLEHGLIKAYAFVSLRRDIDSRIIALVPDLIGLTDAFGLSDWELNSTLGGSAGRPYEDLLQYADATMNINLGNRQFEADVSGILQDGRSALTAKESKL